ncbi:MAG: restriction endonuclease subunit S [Alphaproteobacteria bacterium]|nr:restriction endonuclease subunit S [Alphaproteobacteria bacterium]
MTPQDLIAAFDTLAEAPDGVARLRELVLQLAVRGKLVPQDAGEKRAPMGASQPEVDEEPFELPESWSWMRLPEVARYAVGKTPPTKDPRFWADNQIPWVSIGDMPDGGTVVQTGRTVTQTAATEVFRKPLVPAGTLLMSFKLTIGKVALLGVDAYHNEAIISVQPKTRLIMRDFLIRVLPMMARGGESKDAIKGATLNSKSLARILVPTPPLAEQHRIIARVDELMGLLDRLEAARTARDSTRAAARDAALAALREADTPEDVEVAWNRFAERMDDLLCDPADIDPLRQAVLQLAVRGKLVPQDPEDEPASVLLERVAAEKARLVREDTGRRPKALPPWDRGDVPFVAPSGWSWVRFEDICTIGSGVTKGRKLAGRQVREFPYLRVANVQAGALNLEVIKSIAIPPEEYDGYSLVEGDVLLTEGGDWDKLGRSAIWHEEIPLCIHQNHVFRARSVRRADVLPRWMSMFTNSPMGRDYFQSCSKQTTNLASINKTQLRACPFPVPPSAEQRRIVARVDELTGLLDRLEASLIVAHTTHGSFAGAAVHHLDT